MTPLPSFISLLGYFLFSFAQKKGWVKKARRSKAFACGFFELDIEIATSFFYRHLTCLLFLNAAAGTNDKSEWLKGTVADKSKKK